MSVPLPPDDPAQVLFRYDENGNRINRSTPNEDIYEESCYICRDPEFAQMGLPLCYACRFCGGHVAADDPDCWDCGKDNTPYPPNDGG